MADNQRLYIVVRQDLPHGLQAAQAVHAAFEFSDEHPEWTEQWMSISNYLVILSVPDEPTLDALRATAVLKGMDITVVREPDLDMQVTAVAFEPSDKSRRMLGSLSLAMRQEAMTG